MLRMVDRLLDYKFWFNEIKAYRILKNRLTPLKAICFLGFLDMSNYDFTVYDLVVMKPSKHPILVAKDVYIFSFLKHAVVNCHKYWNSRGYVEEMAGYQIEACFNRNYDFHYNYVYDC
jgi:hypothetical protein